MPAYKGTFIFDRYSCWEERRGCHYYQCDMRSKNLFLKRTVGIGKPCSQPQIPTFISPVNTLAVPISCHCFFLLHQKHITENNTLQWLLKGPAMNQLFSNGSCNQQATLETFANHADYYDRESLGLPAPGDTHPAEVPGLCSLVC